MERIILKGNARVIGNKQDLKQLRRNAEVPCVIYGNKYENVNFSVNEKELREITHSPKSYIIEVDVNGQKHECVYHQAQFHPVTDETIHVDFLAVSHDKPVVINVPIVITGNSDGVKQGGKLLVSARKLKISALLDKLPDELTVDITTLQLGKTIVAGDLSFDDVQIVSPKSTIICSVKMTRAALGAAAAAAATKK